MESVLSAGRSLGGCGVRLNRLRTGKLTHAREEEGLINPTVEDRDAPFDALDDHIASLQAGFAGQFGGRQVIGHRGVSPLPFAVHCMAPSMPLHSDAHNATGQKAGSPCAISPAIRRLMNI